ncbi:hypothetical protein LCGC14_2226400 [marine sediment metagenome]|uniref:Uncharacterized protein n=1 Tax=marine sediment metagenome TaxID=412755 RepID=A0A0F9DX45_9ZZZZ
MLKYPNTADRKWVRGLSAGAGAFSDPEVIPGFVDDLVAFLKPGAGGTALLQFTADDEDLIDTSPGSVDWVDWAIGVVSVDTAQTALGAVTAVRIQATTQPATCRLVGNRRTIRRG